MTYIDEVCAVLLDDVEQKYLNARAQLDEAKAANDAPDLQRAKLIEDARKDYLRASKEYLAIAFKSKFLGVDLK